MNLNEAIIEIRKNHCQECQNRFTEQEIDDGAKCDICKKCEELGKTVAHLQD